MNGLVDDINLVDGWTAEEGSSLPDLSYDPWLYESFNIENIEHMKLEKLLV